MDKTENDMIFIERDTPLSRQKMDNIVAELRNAAAAWDLGDGVPPRQMLMETIPSFYDPETLNRTAEKSKEMQCAL